MVQGAHVIYVDCKGSQIPQNGTLMMFNDVKLAALCGKPGSPGSDRILWTEHAGFEEIGKVA